MHLLLHNSDKAEMLASDFPAVLHDNSWKGNSHPYFIAFYISIIMKFCGHEENLQKCVEIMNETRVPLDATLRNLLQSFSASSSSHLNLNALVNSLTEKIPGLALEKL